MVLDVGCGDGRVLVTMAKVLGCRGIGIDISQVRQFAHVYHTRSITPEVSFFKKFADKVDRNTPPHPLFLDAPTDVMEPRSMITRRARSML